MSQSLNEFTIRVEELSNDLLLLAQAFDLRPRIQQALDFEKRGEALECARRFSEIVGCQPAYFCGPMLVRLAASFERYLRLLMHETVELWAKKAGSFDRLPDGLAERNLVLSGRLIAASESPRDYMAIDPIALIENLSTCKTGASQFKLNSNVFTELVYGITPEVIEKSLAAIRIGNWKDIVGADKELQRKLGVSRVPDAKKEMTSRLKRLARWRNNWAHGGDEEVSLTFPELNDELAFLVAFTKALDGAVTKIVNQTALR
jgi:hypothetical protein